MFEKNTPGETQINKNTMKNIPDSDMTHIQPFNIAGILPG